MMCSVRLRCSSCVVRAITEVLTSLRIVWMLNSHPPDSSVDQAANRDQLANSVTSSPLGSAMSNFKQCLLGV